MPRLADRCLESLRLPPHDTEMIVLDDNYWDFIGILFQTFPNHPPVTVPEMDVLYVL